MGILETGKAALGAGGFDPLSAGLSLGLGTLGGLASGEKFKHAFTESLPLVGGIFKGARARKEAGDAEMEAAISRQNSDAKFGQMQGSNIPMAYGGETGSGSSSDLLNPATKVEAGGTHEQNPLGGIPMGTNSVEEGEVKFKFPDGDYVFSNRLIYNYANK